MSSRNLKLRAIENGIYDKFHLTRIRFEVMPDLMTTDMGNSYLALRTTLRDGITRAIVDTQQSTNEVPIFFCLGDGQTAYDGTALFRTAKLFNKATGAVIEELNYNNVRTNTFKEFSLDFENLASDTIESGLGIPDNRINNLQSTYTLWTNAKNNTVELHIPLKSIFPSLNVPFYQLSAVGGLLIDLELDTTHPLVMSYSNPELVIPPPLVLKSGFIGFTTTEEEEASWLVRAQVNSQFAPIEKPFAVERPEYWEFPRVRPAGVSEEDRYWKTIAGLSVYGAPGDDDNYPGTDLYEWAPQRENYTDADIQELTLFPLSVDPLYTAEIHARLVGDAGETPFIFADSIVGTSTAGLQFTRKHELIRLGTEGNGGGFFDAIWSPVSSTDEEGQNPLAVSHTIEDREGFILLKDLRKITITPDFEAVLVKAHILRKLDNAVVANEDTSFKLYLQMYPAAGQNIYIAPNRQGIIDNVDTIVTNQKFQLPYDEEDTFTVSLYDPLTKVLTFDRPMNLDFVQDERAAHDFYTIVNEGGNGNAKAIILAGSAVLFFQEVQPERFPFKLLPHYPSCDLAEMVLVQYPPTKTQMPKFYRTMKVEPFVIPRDMNEIVQNFMLEPNTYNAWVVIPLESADADISTQPSLISGDGGVLKFRATIDEVDVVNRDIQLGTYPDSLYWDKLADAFSNSAMPMKTLTGTVGRENQRPVRVFPVRIYGGLVNGVVSFSNFMKRLQIRLVAPQDAVVQSGTAYLYKELYKAY